MVVTRLIRTEEEYRTMLARIEEIFHAEPGTPEFEELDLLAHLVEIYENEVYPIDPPDPIDVLRFYIEQKNLKQKDLVPYLGAASRVSEVLSGKRKLTTEMIVKLHEGLGIPLASLLGTKD